MKFPKPTEERGRLVLHILSAAHSRLIYERPAYGPMRGLVMEDSDAKNTIIRFIETQVISRIDEDLVQELGSAEHEDLKKSFIKLFEAFLRDEDPPEDLPAPLPIDVVDIIMDTMVILITAYQSFANGLRRGMDLQLGVDELDDETRDALAKKAHLN